MSAHTLGLLVWALIGAACLTLWLSTYVSGAGPSRLGALTDSLTQRPLVRVLLVLGWMWLGWHTFAR